jgi:hypothetical protein
MRLCSLAAEPGARDLQVTLELVSRWRGIPPSLVR